MSEATRTTYGPFRTYARGMNGIPNEMVTIPFDKVRGANLIVAINDNMSSAQPNLLSSNNWATVEVCVDGAVAGYFRRLKIQQVRMMTGPLSMYFSWDTPYDSIRILARNVTGGVENNDINPSLVVLDLNVYIQPVGGFNIPQRNR